MILGQQDISIALFQSPSIFRHAFYETFLHIHFLLAGLAVGAVYVHLAYFPKVRKLIVAVLGLWIAEVSETTKALCTLCV